MQNAVNVGESQPPSAFLKSNEKKIIACFCLLAAIHVFVFSAAFPFFNNVDEPAHFDLIVKYSHGHLPRGKETYSPDAAAYLAIFSSCAYDSTPDQFADGKMPSPPWAEPAQKMQQDLLETTTALRSKDNYEVSQPPLYYTVAGFAWHTGQSLHADSGHLLYYLRFLNILAVAASVCLGYIAARLIFPENVFLRLGVPGVLALMPQTVFYSLGNDILSPLCFGMTFILFLKWLQKPSTLIAAATGLAFAATWLSKATNLPLLAVIAAAVLGMTWLNVRQGKSGESLSALGAFAGCAALPMACWAMWCKASFGDFTGSKLKAEYFDWTVKPFSEWWHHPIFTPAGLWTYLSGQISTFWQGEFDWHGQRLASPASDVLYTILTLALMVVAGVALFSASLFQRRALLLGLLCFVAGLGFFGLMSIIYNFHEGENPSPSHPYFHAGRMILGALVPFLLLVVYGLDRLLNRFGDRAKFLVLALLVSSMLAAEIATDWPVFSNPFNWFHLP